MNEKKKIKQNTKNKNSLTSKKDTNAASKSNNDFKSNSRINNQNKKKNTAAKNNVKVEENINKKEDLEILEQTNSFDIIIDDERLKDKESLDFSFIDSKRKKKKAHDDIEILEEVDYKEEAKKIDIPQKENRKGDFFSTLLIIVFSFILGFLICFIWARESGYFVEKEVIIEEVVVDDNYVFLGDSIFERYDLDKFYSDMPVVNSGVSGNKTSDILKNLKNRLYRYNPSKVILMIGTNDYSSISNEDTVKNISKIIDGIKKNRPNTKIYVQSIYPVNKNINDGDSVGGRNNRDISTMNEGIKKICQEKEVVYMNIYDLLVDDDGNLKVDYTNDGLHLTDYAYEVITKEVMKVLKN